MKKILKSDQINAHLNGLMHNSEEDQNKLIREDDDQIITQTTLFIQGTKTFGKQPSKIIEHQNAKITPQKILNKTPMSENEQYILQTSFQTCQNAPQKVTGKQRNKFPYCSIGYLTMVFPQFKCVKKIGQNNEQALFIYPKIQAFGTAALISRNHLLTAAHNLYNKERKQKASEIFFFCGLDGNSHTQEIIVKQKQNQKGIKQPLIYIPEQYMNQNLSDDERREWDFAICELNCSHLQYQLFQQFGYLGINSQVDLSVQDLSIIGYPYTSETFLSIKNKILNKTQAFQIESQKNTEQKQNQISSQIISPKMQLTLAAPISSTSQGKYLYKGQGKTYSWSQNKSHISYLIPTQRGQSGSPILRKIPNSKLYQIVGIHTHSNIKEQFNAGVKITKKVIDKINQWIFIDKITLEKSSNSLKILNFSTFAPSLLKLNEFLRNISVLCLGNNKLGDQAMQELAKNSKKLSKLQDLDLYKNLITNTGMIIFLNKQFSSLQRFDTFKNQYDQNIAKYFLQKRQNFPCMQTLHLHKGNHEQLKKLKENIKNVRVYIRKEID